MAAFYSHSSISFLLAFALISSVSATVIPRTIRLPISPLQARSDGGSDDWLQLIRSVNMTFSKYDYPPLAPIPGLESRNQSLRRDLSSESPRRSSSGQVSGEPRKTTSLHKREGKPGSAVLIGFVDTVPELHFGHSKVGSTAAAGAAAEAIETVFDTGTPWYIVPGASCKDSNGCTGDRKYSETGRDLGIDWGGGGYSSRGRLFSDDVQVADLVARGAEIVSLSTNSNLLASAQGQTVARMGLRPADNVSNDGGAADLHPNVFETLVRQNAVDKPEFSFFFGRAEDAGLFVSELLLGGRMPERMASTDVQTLPVVQASPEMKLWTVTVSDIIVNGQGLSRRPGQDVQPDQSPTSPGPAILDTISPVIALPYDVAAMLMGYVPNAATFTWANEDDKHFWVFPCDAVLPSIAFRMGDSNTDFEIDPRDFLGARIQMADLDPRTFLRPNWPAALLARREVCLSSVVGFAYDPTKLRIKYHLGLPFLRSYHTTFDMADGAQKVHLAKARHAPTMFGGLGASSSPQGDGRSQMTAPPDTVGVS